jgi:hypothetical protein
VITLASSAAALAQTPAGTPHLARHGDATQLIVDGKPMLLLAGELGNNAATSLEAMEPIWPKLVATHLNTVLIAVSWAQLEPQEGHFDFALVDGLIAQAREHHEHIVFLWFGSWKNGFSSYAPTWVKQDSTRFPRIQIGNGSTVSMTGPVELLSTFGDATRDADAAAFAALMHHIGQVDSTRHTVVMMQVENEMGVLRDSRDRSPAANRAFNGPVPEALMQYLIAHKESLIPELRDVWAANGYKTSGTWEQVFGPGRPAEPPMPLQTLSPPMGQFEHETAWQHLHWPADEFFMAWNYARYVETIVHAGKAQYNIPMYVNAWLQQSNHAWPGSYPSGGPLPQVHDLWRAGAPDIDILSPDLYLKYFGEVCARYTRSGNPLFIPETGTNPANALLGAGKYNMIGFSPFGLAGTRSSTSPHPEERPETELGETYKLLDEFAPMILAHQGTDTMTALELNDGDQPVRLQLGGYTLELTYTGKATWLPPTPKDAPLNAPLLHEPGYQAAAILIASAPNEFYFGGGGMRIGFTPNTPGPPNVGLGDVQIGHFVDGKWVVLRQLGGDDTTQGEMLLLPPNTLMRATVYRAP